MDDMKKQDVEDRLDPNTLIFAAGAIKGIHEKIGGPRSMAVCQSAHDRFIALAVKNRAQGPRLSAWIAACEGTSLGEPSFRIVTGSDGCRWMDVRFRDSFMEVASFHVDTSVPDLFHAYYVDRDGQAVDVASPADLRAALENFHG